MPMGSHAGASRNEKDSELINHVPTFKVRAFCSRLPFLARETFSVRKKPRREDAQRRQNSGGTLFTLVSSEVAVLAQP